MNTISYGLVFMACFALCSALHPQFTLFDPPDKAFYERGLMQITLKKLVKSADFDIVLHRNAAIPDRNISLLTGTINNGCNLNLKEYKPCDLITSTTERPRVLRFRCNHPSFQIIAVYARNIDEPVREIKLVRSTPFNLDGGVAVTTIKDEVNERYSGLRKEVLKGEKWSGVINLVSWNATALAVSKRGNILVAMSAFGSGKLVMFSNKKYLDDKHSTTVNYLIKWASKNNASSVDIAKEIKKNNGVVPADVSAPMVWNVDHVISRKNVNELKNRVKNGATLAMFITSWEYVQRFKMSLKDASWFSLVTEAGLWPSTEVARDVKKAADTIVVGNEEARNTHSLDVQSALATMSLREFPRIVSGVDILYELPKKFMTRTGLMKRVRRRILAALNKWKPFIETIIPCMYAPIKDQTMKDIFLTYNILMNLPLLADSGFKAPGTFIYPGEVVPRRTEDYTTPSAEDEYTETTPARWDSTSGTTDTGDNVETTSVTQVQKVPLPDEVVATGYYLMAGKTTQITVVDGDSSTCNLFVNFQLFDVDDNDEYEKWPLPSSETDNFKTGTKLHTALGGLLWIYCKQSRIFKYQLTNVVEAPMWDFRNMPSNEEWIRRRDEAPGLWATIAGDSVVIVVPTSAIRDLDDPLNVMKKYDLAFKTEFHLAGYTTANRRREIMSVDVQIIAGLMHNGYPIGVSLKFAVPGESGYLFDAAAIKQSGSWGTFHELGHNLQSDAYLFEGCVEVSCNIFTLRGTEVVTGQYFFTPKSDWIKTDKIKIFLLNPNYNAWKKDTDVALVIFAQLAHHFGWELYRQLFRRYRDMSPVELKALKPNQAKIDRLIIELSQISNHNVAPLFDFWGFPIGPVPKTGATSQLKPFLPDDFVMKMSQWKHYTIIGQYGITDRTVSRLNQTIGQLTDPQMIRGSPTLQETL